MQEKSKRIKSSEENSSDAHNQEGKEKPKVPPKYPYNNLVPPKAYLTDAEVEEFTKSFSASSETVASVTKKDKQKKSLTTANTNRSSSPVTWLTTKKLKN